MIKTDLMIIGAGPAGCSAAIYAVRSGVKTMIAGGAMPGGQLLQTNDLENYAGFENPVGGFELMTAMHKQCKRLGVEILTDKIVKIEGEKTPFILTAESGEQYESMAVIIAAGASARWLGVSGEEKLKGHGVSACATCDGFFFRGKEVVVVGGGNTAFEDALFLSQFCPKVTLVHRREGFRADAVTVEKVKNTPNISMMLNCVIDEVIGQEKVTAAILRNVKTQEKTTLSCDGIFVAVGAVPQTDWLKESAVKLTENGLVQVDAHQQTNVAGIFAAGDCTEPEFRQAIVAAGSGAKAGISAASFINLHR
ncbi:MAG: thioredoxin-disulfide reductase [Elusimicrobiaceae bacterium]|nr:thioredoxin-disulfide reductase [Elusimicrobiaceae bacterium]MBR2505127.1 thioredoxin-disulfide reductase [Elusimicrobiaceae bacterium]